MIKSMLSLFRLKTGFAAIVQTMWANVLIMGANLIAGVLTARYLGPQGRGELAALVTTPSLLAVLFNLAIPSALVVYLRADREEQGRLYGAAFAILSILSILTVVCGEAVVGPLLGGNYNPEIVRFAHYALLMAPLGLLQNFLLPGVRAAEDFRAYNRIRYGHPLINVVLIILLGMSGVLTPLTAAIVTLLSGAPLLVWNLHWVIGKYHPTFINIGPPARRLLSYGVRAFGGDLFGSIAGQFDRLILLAIFQPAMLGIYVVAVNLSRVIGMLSSSISTVLLPKIAGIREDQIGSKVEQMAAVCTMLSALAVVVLLIAGPLLLRLLYGMDFVSGALAFRLLVVEASLGGIATVMNQAFLALGKPGTITGLQGISVVLSISLLLLLAPRYGLEGAGSALLIGTSARFILTYMSLGRLLNRKSIRLWLGYREILGFVATGLQR